MYTLIGIVIAFFALSASVSLPTKRGFCNERRVGGCLPRDVVGSQDTVARKAALALDGVYMPIPL